MIAYFNELPEFVQGALLVLLGFAFAIIWDLYKSNRKSKIKEKAVIFSLQKEIVSIKAQIEHNKTLLFPGDISSFMDKPLVPMSLKEVWQFVSYNSPKQIVQDQELVTTLLNIVVRCEQFNAHIGTREAFRVTQKALSGYEQTLKMYENMISGIIEGMEPLVNEASKKIEAFD
jgi:hypothetical protein